MGTLNLVTGSPIDTSVRLSIQGGEGGRAIYFGVWEILPKFV
jgi:hypothetical protein